MNFYIPALEYVIPPLLWGLLLPLLLLGLYALMQRRRAPDAVPYSGLYLLRGALGGVQPGGPHVLRAHAPGDVEDEDDRRPLLGHGDAQGGAGQGDGAEGRRQEQQRRRTLVGAQRLLRQAA